MCAEGPPDEERQPGDEIWISDDVFGITRKKQYNEVISGI